MAGEIKKLRRSEGITVSAPTDLSVLNKADSLVVYASDAAYVAAKGAVAENGDLYYNTTRHRARIYENGSWVDLGNFAQYLVSYASDAAYVADLGTAADGNCYYNTATDTARLYAAGAWTDLGSGGGGSLNYITMSDGTPYKDAAQAMPEDGTGGTANVTYAANSTDPLIGSQDYIIQKDAANRIGEGVSWDFQIDRIFKDAPQIFKIKLHFAGTSLFSADDIVFYIYDKDGTNLIQPSTYQLNATQGLFEATFQPQAGNDDYRLILHVATVNASAWDLQVASIEVGPQTKVYGPPATDWVDNESLFTEDFTNETLIFLKTRRVGDSMEGTVQYTFSGAGGAATPVTFTLVGVTIDTDKLPVGGNATAFNANGTWFDSGVGFKDIRAVPASSTTLKLFEDGASANMDYDEIQASDGISFTFTIPIVGWSSNTQLSNEGETRVVAARVANSTATAIGTTEKFVKFDDTQHDTHATIVNNAMSGVGATDGTLFTAPVTGKYSVYAAFFLDGTGGGYAANTSVDMRIYIDQSEVSYKRDRLPVAGTASVTVDMKDEIELNAGQVMQVSLDTSDANTQLALDVSKRTKLVVSRLAGPSAIAASEVIEFKAYADQLQSIADNTVDVIEFKSLSYDSHNGWDGTDTYTVPAAGLYEIKTYIGDSSVDTLETQAFVGRVKIDGTADDYLWSVQAPSALSNAVRYENGTTKYNLNAGQTISIQAQMNTNGVTWTPASVSYLLISRVGGVG